MVAKVIKRAHPDSKIVFIGPCVAKKGEQKQERVRDLVDVVITFEELQALMDAYEIDMSVLEDDVLNNASYYGRVLLAAAACAMLWRKCCGSWKLNRNNSS